MHASQDSPSPSDSLTGRLRRRVAGPVEAAGRAGARLGVHPDAITALGTLLAGAAGWLVARGEFQKAGLLWLFGAPLDALDGAVARAMNRKDKFGALFDSSLDRYADGALAAGLAVYFARAGKPSHVAGSGAAMIGSFMVSYVRARAEGLGLPSIKSGLFSRLERSALWLVMLFTGRVEAGIWALAVLTNFTAAQRLVTGRRLAAAASVESIEAAKAKEETATNHE